MSEGAATIDEGAEIIKELDALCRGDAILTLTNVYKEVPIVHKGQILEVRGDQVVLETDELQISAMHWSGSTVIQAPTLASPVEGQLDSSDIQRSQVTLSRFRKTELPSQRRATVRVRLKKPARVALTADDAQIAGVIHDISLGGCLIRTGRSRPALGDLTAELELDGQPIRIPARVLRVDGKEPCYECAVAFDHTQETEVMTTSFIHKREHEIIKELHGAS